MAVTEEEFLSYFPNDFKEYMDKELNWLPSKYFKGGLFWSRQDDEPQHPSTLPDGDISNLNKIIRDLLHRTIDCWPDGAILVQFWAPITTKEGRSFLTTRNQPFSLASFVFDRLGIEGLCGYRMICMDSKFDIDLDGGKTCEQHLPARVFKHQFPESTPNVEFYSITEYPQRDDALRCVVRQSLAFPVKHQFPEFTPNVEFYSDTGYSQRYVALGCGVRQSLAFPVFESSTQTCVGVIEVVTLEDDIALRIHESILDYAIFEHFEKKGLKCSIGFDHGYMKLDEAQNEAGTVALDEIKNVLKVVCEDCDLPLAQAWVPCKVGWPCRPLVDGGILGVSCQYYNRENDYDEDECWDFLNINNISHLKNGVGVVGRALSSTGMVLCRDVTQLSLTEYPLAHYARRYGLSGCFAICLQSSCTENDDYVLEFFLPVSNETIENPHALLKKILETMRKDFVTLRVASRKKLGKDFCIEEIGGEKLDRVQRPQTAVSLPWSEPLQSEVAVIQVDSSNQQSMNAINTGSNVGGTECDNIAITCMQEKSTVKESKRKGNKSGVKIKISLEDIRQSSKMKIEDAAKNLQVSKSTLKRACRMYDIDRWPPRNTKKSGFSQPNESVPCVDLEQSSQLNLDDLPFAQPSASIVHTKPHNTAMQDANVVTIKAIYAKGNAIKFRLSLSSRLIELQQEVAQRLNLEAGTYYVKYKDEDGDLILIACDGDLRDYMCVSRLEGKTCIVVLLEPKLPITDHP